ncbi:hypothetical protein LXL04_019558 [Taraxacum kok-saghyz]
MASMLQRERSLPVSHQTSSDDQSSVVAGMRRRLSSMSLRIQPSSITDSTSAATAWAMRRSKSVSSMGESASTSVRNWWDWGWGWILSRKPVFAQDLEFNQEETSVLRSHDKGSWKHVLFKVRSEIRKLVRSDNVGLPQTVRYNSYSYARNFDDGSTKHGPERNGDVGGGCSPTWVDVGGSRRSKVKKKSRFSLNLFLTLLSIFTGAIMVINFQMDTRIIGRVTARDHDRIVDSLEVAIKNGCQWRKQLFIMLIHARFVVLHTHQVKFASHGGALIVSSHSYDSKTSIVTHILLVMIMDVACTSSLSGFLMEMSKTTNPPPTLHSSNFSIHLPQTTISLSSNHIYD